MSFAQTPLTSARRPEIEEYLSVQKYLADYYTWRRSTSHSFSYEAWAKELGFKSRAFLRLLVLGKRSITESSLSLFLQGLSLKKQEAQVFEALVRFSQAKTVAMREKYALELSRIRTKNKGRHEIKDHYRFLSSHLAPRLQVLLSLEDLISTAENLASLLGSPVGEIQEMLETLERLGLAQRQSDASGCVLWRATQSSFDVKDQLGDVALQSFHRRSLQDAIQAIDEPAEARTYRSLIFPLSESEYQALWAENEAHFAILLSKYKASRARGRRLYQMNLNLIPVSRPILHLAEKPSESRREEACHFDRSEKGVMENETMDA